MFQTQVLHINLSIWISAIVHRSPVDCRTHIKHISYVSSTHARSNTTHTHIRIRIRSIWQVLSWIVCDGESERDGPITDK